MPVTPGEQASAHAAAICAVAAHRDREAFALLFGHFAPRVKTYLLRLGTAPSQAEDLAQDAMLAVWRKAALYDPARAAASTWIFAIARNLRLDAARRETRRSAPLTDVDPPPPIQEPDSILVAGQRDACLKSALAALSPEQAEVVRHAFFADMAHSEISAALGLPLGTVKSRLRLAMNRLREALGDLTLGDLK